MAQDVGIGDDQPARELTDEEMERLLRAASGPVEPAEPERVATLLWFAAAMPLIALALLLAMALRVRVGDGVWPVKNQPDPKDLGFHNSATVAAIMLSFAAVFLLPIGTLLAFFTGRRRIPLGPPLLAVAGFVILAVVLRADIGGLGEWIAD